MKIFCVLIILIAITVMMYLSRKVSYFIHAPQKVQPSFEYENLRWRLLMDVKELGNVDSSDDQKLIIESQIEQLEKTDEFEGWRATELGELTTLVQTSIKRNQNPPDCTLAKKLVCHLNHYGCGFGCLMHHTAYCLLTALATQRVLVLSHHPWFYSNVTVKDILAPLSTTCTEFQDFSDIVPQVFSNSSSNTLQLINNYYKILGNYSQPYNPPALPQEISDRLIRLTQDPDAWWFGQFVGFLLKPGQEVRTLLSEAVDKINFTSPVVGVHVRQTDKIGAAIPYHRGSVFYPAMHSIEEFMEPVENWFKKYEMTHPPTKRQIYVASDDPQVLQSFHAKYPNYTIYDNLNNSMAAGLDLRYSEASKALSGVLQDIHLLSMTDFVICTHSSNMCGLLYELLHFKYGDASNRLHSLDIEWQHYYRKTKTFQPIEEDPKMDLEHGDSLEFLGYGNNTQRWVEVLNERTQKGLVLPMYKIGRVYPLYKFNLK